MRLGGLEPHQTYFESFVGAGALFHDLEPAPARLNDASAPLVNCLRAIRATPDAVHVELRALVDAFPPHDPRPVQEAYYNSVRATFKTDVPQIDTPDAAPPALVAAQMIFLNRTCFNGLWRINKKGEYNASLGRYKRPAFPSRADLDGISGRLQKAIITLGDFSVALMRAKAGDLAFLDPPYGGVRGDTGFAAYTAAGFDVMQQRWLVEVVRILHARGVRIILTNGDFPGNREAYEAAGLIVERLNETRSINTDTTGRGAVPCLLAWSRHAT